MRRRKVLLLQARNKVLLPQVNKSKLLINFFSPQLCPPFFILFMWFDWMFRPVRKWMFRPFSIERGCSFFLDHVIKMKYKGDTPFFRRLPPGKSYFSKVFNTFKYSWTNAVGSKRGVQTHQSCRTHLFSSV